MNEDDFNEEISISDEEQKQYAIKIVNGGDLIHKTGRYTERFKKIVIEIKDGGPYLKSITYLVSYEAPFFDKAEFRALNSYYLSFMPYEKYIALEKEIEKAIPTFFTKE